MFEFGEGFWNVISWAPHGRFLILAGFGNMSGELSYYDRKTLKKLSTVDAHMTVHYEWSPDSRYFLTGILFPRLRVDNGYRVWSASGGLVHKEEIAELSLVTWRPQAASLFPEPDESALTAFKPTANLKPTSQAKAYVPPSQRGAAGGGGGRSLADLAESRGVGAAPPAGRSLSSLAAAVEKGGSAALCGNGVPIGAETEESRNTAKNRAKAEAKKKKKAAEAEAGAPPVVTPRAEPPKPPMPAAAAGAAPSEVAEKKVLAVEKKLRQIAELKELKAGGKPLEKNQLDKIEQEAAVLKELADLKLAIETESKSGMWR